MAALEPHRDITGSSVTYSGGGGGGGDQSRGGAIGTGGVGGGADGTAGDTTPTPATANTGGGGGGSGYNSGAATGGTGGSGVVIIKVPDNVTATFSGGVDFGNNSPDFDNGLPITSVAGFNIYFVSGTDTGHSPSFTADFLVVAGTFAPAFTGGSTSNLLLHGNWWWFMAQLEGGRLVAGTNSVFSTIPSSGGGGRW
jgi:hypothetical protein